MSEKIRITGGRQLKGEVFISGAKNAVLKLMAAALLARGESKIYNVYDVGNGFVAHYMVYDNDKQISEIVNTAKNIEIQIVSPLSRCFSNESCVKI